MEMSTKESSVVEAISAYGPARSTIKGAPLSAEELEKIDAYWRASSRFQETKRPSSIPARVRG